MVTKRLVDIDDDLLEQARAALGTKTLKDTVNLSLMQAAHSASRTQRAREVDWDAFADAIQDLGNPEIMAGAWE